MTSAASAPGGMANQPQPTSAVPIPNPASPPPPNKRDLKSWWKGFKIPSKHQESHGRHPSACASHYTKVPLQPLFSEDVEDRLDTSTSPLHMVLRLQDAHVIVRGAAVSSGVTALGNARHPEPLDKLSRKAKSPLRRSARNLRNMMSAARCSRAKQASIETRPPGIFGVPLRQSITYANVAISLIDENGKSYIYGYVPIVVAKCGVFLKEKATGVEGIFRLSGSEKRIKELKNVFDSPDRYGKGLVWDGYTVHDAANVLRRYLNDLPEPVVPLDLYEKFRQPLRGATKQAVGDAEGPQFVDNFDEPAAIAKYQQLITELPPLNRQLLLYILDLLAVFAAKSDENRMNSQNLAAIFQPGMLSHPAHAMAPEEYRLNQCVIIFLIENQDHFLIGMQGTGTDEKTKQEIEKGTPPISGPTTPNPNRKSGLGRSASTASAGADSVRRDGKIRRNRSTSSRHSRNEGTTTPGTPTLAPTPTGGLTRSNTVPSKKSPALPTGRFQKPETSPVSATHGVNPGEPLVHTASNDHPSSSEKSPASSSILPSAVGTSTLFPGSIGGAGRSQERLLEAPLEVLTPSRERNLQSLFQRSPTGESDKRQPNKLKKKRIPGSLNPSAQSSNASLSHSTAVSPTVEVTNPMERAENAIPENAPISSGQLSTGDTPSEPTPRASQVPSNNSLYPENTLKPKKSLPTSLHSSFNEGSDIDQVDEQAPHALQEQPDKEKERKKRWRLSRRKEEAGGSPYPPLTSPRIAYGSNENAEISRTSIGSAAHRPRKSFTADSSEPTLASAEYQTSHESGGREKENREGGKDDAKGPIGWIRSKYREAKENAEQKRNKSPPADRQSLGGSSTLLASRGKSLDMRREEEKYTQQQQPPHPSSPPPHPPAATSQQDHAR